MQPRWLDTRRRAWLGASAPCVRRRETPNPGSWWRELWRARIPGEHRRCGLSLAWSEVDVRTDSRGEQSFEGACRPLTGEPSVGGKGTVRAARLRVEATGLAIAGNLRHGSCVRGPPQGGFVRRAKSRREQAKAVVKLLPALRRRQSEIEPQVSKGPRERVRLPGKGKL
jgi:hypothetical protein